MRPWPGAGAGVPLATAPCEASGWSEEGSQAWAGGGGEGGGGYAILGLQGIGRLPGW